MNREKAIIRTSIIGILANVFLAGFKATIGWLTNSIAITLDAVNNLSDALSSVITIVGTKLAGRKPDKKHPLGHGRIEYITAMIIGVIVLYAGVTALVEAVKAIITPQTPDYTPVPLLIIAVAVAVKLVLGWYVSRVGKRVRSDSLVASGKDATLDAVISLSTLAAAGVYLLWGISLEAWLGAIISLIIIKAGVDMLRETLSQILGERVASETAIAVKETIAAFPDVMGAYDLILHNYGPDMLIGSVHIEVPDTLSVKALDKLERDIQQVVYEQHGIVLTGVSIYCQNTEDAAARILDTVRQTVMEHDYVLQMHGFYVNEEERELRFDVVIDFAAPDREAVYTAICEDVQSLCPDYRVQITLDSDISD
ncbi:MAG: cation transporter [Clostridia bacterium]|nr:cation transporter [Clostridia bacterium]